MTTDQAGKHEGPQSQESFVSLDAFLNKFADLTSQLSNGMLDQATDADEKELIAAYAKPLSEQVVQLNDYIIAPAMRC